MYFVKFSETDSFNLFLDALEVLLEHKITITVRF